MQDINIRYSIKTQLYITLVPFIGYVFVTFMGMRNFHLLEKNKYNPRKLFDKTFICGLFSLLGVLPMLLISIILEPEGELSLILASAATTILMALIFVAAQNVFIKKIISKTKSAGQIENNENVGIKPDSD